MLRESTGRVGNGIGRETQNPTGCVACQSVFEPSVRLSTYTTPGSSSDGRLKQSSIKVWMPLSIAHASRHAADQQQVFRRPVVWLAASDASYVRPVVIVLAVEGVMPRCWTVSTTIRPCESERGALVGHWARALTVSSFPARQEQAMKATPFLFSSPLFP